VPSSDDQTVIILGAGFGVVLQELRCAMAMVAIVLTHPPHLLHLGALVVALAVHAALLMASRDLLESLTFVMDLLQRLWTPVVALRILA